MRSSTAVNWVLSWRCPSVMTTASGRPFPSPARWILVVRPPRLRPSASPATGLAPPFFAAPSLGRLSPGSGSVLVSADRGGVHRGVDPGQLPAGIGLVQQPLQDPLL